MNNFIKNSTLYYRGGDIPLQIIMDELGLTIPAIQHRLGGRTAWTLGELYLLYDKYGIAYNELRNELFKD